MNNLLEFNSLLSIIIRVLIILILGLGIYLSVIFSNKFLNDEDKIRINKLKILRIFLYFSFVIFLISIYHRFSIIRLTLITFIVSIIVAYILNPVVNYLENKKIKRLYAIFAVYLVIALSVAVLIIGIFPGTLRQFRNLFMALPDLVKNFIDYSDTLRKDLFNNIPIINQIITGLNSQLIKLANTLTSEALNYVTAMVVKFTSLISVVIQLILIPVITFYLLLEKDKIFKTLKSKTPEKYDDFLRNLWKEIDYSLSMFVRGRIVMAIFVGVATTIYLAVMGIEFALVIGIITCVADIIPYIGPFLGFIPAVLLALIKGPITAIWVAVLFCIVQWLENNILGPKILGDSTGMHPLVVLILLIVGGGMFGVAGMILSVPIASAIKIVFKHTKPYIVKYLYKDKVKR